MAMERANCSASPMGDAAQTLPTRRDYWRDYETPSTRWLQKRTSCCQIPSGSPGQVIFFFWLSKCQPKWSTPSPEAYPKRQFSPGTHGPEPYGELCIQLGTRKKIPDRMSEYVPEKLPERTSEYLSDRNDMK